MKIGVFLLLLGSLLISNNLKIDFGKDGMGQDWQVINDGVMGGLSTGTINFTDTSLVFKGSVSLENFGGFTAFKSPFQATNLSDYEYVSIRLKVKEQQFALTLETDQNFYQPYYKKVIATSSEEWETVRLKLSDFKEWRLGQATGKQLSKASAAEVLRIGLITNEKKAGDFEVEVDYLVFE
ncbi:MAG: CIA30 family protein [Bacteroidota bacterium]